MGGVKLAPLMVVVSRCFPVAWSQPKNSWQIRARSVAHKCRVARMSFGRSTPSFSTICDTVVKHAILNIQVGGVPGQAMQHAAQSSR